MFDGWLSLLRNCEKYWTEYSPYVFVFEELKKGDLNYQTKTAEYKLDFSTKFSQKYTAIMKETIIEGCRKSYKKDWPIDEHWPTNSVFTPKDGTPEQILSKYGVAVLKYPKVEGEGVVLHSEDVPGWGKVFIRYENDKDYYSPSVFANYYGTEHLGIITGTTERDENLYDVKFELCDKDGKLIAKSERTLMANVSGEGTCSYTFKGISSDKMSLLDNSQYMIKVTDVFLQYGTYNPKNEDKTGRGFIKNLSEISIPVSKIEYEVKGIKEIKDDALVEMRKKQELEKIMEKKVATKNKIVDIIETQLEKKPPLIRKKEFADFYINHESMNGNDIPNRDDMYNFVNECLEELISENTLIIDDYGIGNDNGPLYTPDMKKREIELMSDFLNYVSGKMATDLRVPLMKFVSNNAYGPYSEEYLNVISSKILYKNLITVNSMIGTYSLTPDGKAFIKENGGNEKSIENTKSSKKKSKK